MFKLRKCIFSKYRSSFCHLKLDRQTRYYIDIKKCHYRLIFRKYDINCVSNRNDSAAQGLIEQNE